MPSARKRVAVLMSGGMDSTILLRELLKTHTSVYPLYVSSGNIWEKAEYFWLRKFLSRLNERRVKPLTLLTLPAGDLYGNFWSLSGRNVPGKYTLAKSVYLPGKNILLLAKASVYCLQKKIPAAAIGVLGTNPFPDASRKFFAAYERTLTKGLGFPFKILTPFLALSKKQVMKKAGSLPLELTFSCLKPKKNFHCGRCNKCMERKKAFRSIGVLDPTVYAAS